jgi:hypothetical protein
MDSTNGAAGGLKGDSGDIHFPPDRRKMAAAKLAGEFATLVLAVGTRFDCDFFARDADEAI